MSQEISPGGDFIIPYGTQWPAAYPFFLSFPRKTLLMTVYNSWFEDISHHLACLNVANKVHFLG